MKELSIGQQIVDKVSSLIQPYFFDGAQLLLQENTSLLDSIIIKIDNNPWRNGVIKGNAIFARIKSSGGNAYINVKDKFEEIFDTFGVVKLPVPESESKYDWIRIELQSFLKLLNDPSHDFIQAINDMFVECIAFPSFGCCSFPCAANMDEALKNAREALGLHLWSMEKDGDEIPEPTPITQIRCNANEVPAVIDVFMPPFRDKLIFRGVAR